MKNLNIEFGSNGRKMDGWICMSDVNECDIRKPLQWEDNCASQLFCEHCFEHVSPAQGLHFLDECYRILQPGGVLRLCVPVISENLPIDHARDLILGHGHEAAYTPTLLKTFLALAGFRERNINFTARKNIDNHWQTIGLEKDNAETCRIEATK